MATLYIIIAALVGAIIILFIVFSKKPKELEKEIARLRRVIASEGVNFEQVEYKIASLKDDIVSRKKLIGSGKRESADIVRYLEKMEKDLDGILEKLLSGNSMK